jgi:hypothetical protein
MNISFEDPIDLYGLRRILAWEFQPHCGLWNSWRHLGVYRR